MFSLLGERRTIYCTTRMSVGRPAAHLESQRPQHRAVKRESQTQLLAWSRLALGKHFRRAALASQEQRKQLQR